MEYKRVEDEIADRLAMAMSLLSDNVPEIAERMGVSKLNVYRYIAKTRKASMTFCRDFCDMYEIDYEWLMTGRGMPRKKDDFDSLDEPAKTELLNFIASNKTVIACYLRDETDYKEPYIIKSYRHAKSISRKVMKRLLLRGSEEIRKG